MADADENLDMSDLDDEVKAMILKDLKEQEEKEQQAAEAEAAAAPKKGFWKSTGNVAKKVGGWGWGGMKKMYSGTAKATSYMLGRGGGQKLSKEEQAALDAQLKKINETRHSDAHASGGLRCVDHQVIKDQRSVVHEVLKQMGRNLLSGNDLLYVTFPVRCSAPHTVLQLISKQSSYAPNFLGRAAAASDPLERFKLVITNYVASLHCTTGFHKPLNPILGETYEGSMEDGTAILMEQTSHHPPVSSWQVMGPESTYHFSGWVSYKAAFGYNKLKVTHVGKRVVDFKDGGRVTFTNPIDQFCNTFWGEVRHETFGTIHFEDEANKLACDLTFNPNTSLPSDAVFGVICRVGDDETVEPEELATVEGSWLGFVDIDGTRYWDINADKKYDIKAVDDPLPSDSRFRKDLQLLQEGNMAEAQLAKTELEEWQRRDRKLRKECAESA